MRNSNKASHKGNTKSKEISLEEVRGKLARFCSYQERTEKQVIHKMALLGAPEDWFEEIVAFLKNEGYLNETRFTESLIRGKINGRGWGPQKIAMKLRMEGVFNSEAKAKLKEADFTIGEQKLKGALEKKKANLLKKADPNWKVKLIRFCLSKGYELEKARTLVAGLN